MYQQESKYNYNSSFFKKTSDINDNFKSFIPEICEALQDTDKILLGNNHTISTINISITHKRLIIEFKSSYHIAYNFYDQNK